MTRPLPPPQYIIDQSKVSSYKQSPYGLCYFFTFISSISNVLAKKHDCNIQISVWDFIKCMESFLSGEAIYIDVDSKQYSVKFVADPPASFEQTTDKIIMKTNLSNSLSDIDKILLDKIFTTNEDFVIENVYSVIPSGGFGEVFGDLLPEQIFLDPDNGGIPQKFRSKWTRGKLYITNINSIDRISIDELLDYNSTISNKESIDTIKNNYSNNQNLGFQSSLFFVDLFKLTNIPVKITCGKFDSEPETNNNVDYTGNTNCFKELECSLKIGYRGEKSLEIRDLNEAKSFLSNDKTIIWDAPPLMTKLLVLIDKCNRALNSGESLQDYIDGVKNNPLNLQGRADCENSSKALDLMLSFLESIFLEGPISGPINLSSIDYFSNNEISELSKDCSDTYDNVNDIKNIIIGESHVMMVYGYKENPNDTIDIYVINTWGGGGATSDKFVIRIKNNTILNDEKDWGLGKFGNFKYFQDKDMVIEEKPDICDCCETSSSSSSSEDEASSSSSVEPDDSSHY